MFAGEIFSLHIINKGIYSTLEICSRSTSHGQSWSKRQWKTCTESLAFIHMVELKRAIAGCCNVEYSEVRLAFHWPIALPNALRFFKHCDLLIEINLVGEAGLLVPYADQTRNRILRNVESLRIYTIEVCIPVQYPRPNPTICLTKSKSASPGTRFVSLNTLKTMK